MDNITQTNARTYTVSGMTCGHCVRSVTAEVSGIPGVHGVEVDLVGRQVTVVSDRPVDRDQLAAAVREAGYQLEG